MQTKKITGLDVVHFDKILWTAAVIQDELKHLMYGLALKRWYLAPVSVCHPIHLLDLLISGMVLGLHEAHNWLKCWA